MATQHDAISAWNQLDDGQQKAVIKKLWLAGGGKKGGMEAFWAILRGELRVDLTDVSVKLIDATVRAIPPAKFGYGVTDANTSFSWTKPTLDLRAIYDAYRAIIPAELSIVTFEEFVGEYQAIMGQIEANRQVANAKNGLCLPVIMPKHDIDDYGQVLEDLYLKMVEAAYKKAFSNRTFENCRRGELTGQVQVVPETRHDRLLSLMCERSVVGVYNPIFQGFGLEADRAIMKLFPDNWLLAGPIDTAMAIVGPSATLASDFNTPALDCAAVQWQDPEVSLCFIPDDSRLFFDDRSLRASECFSGGVLVLRQP